MRFEVDRGRWGEMVAALTVDVVAELGPGLAAKLLELSPPEIERITADARAVLVGRPRRAVKISPVAVDLDRWDRMLAALLINVVDSAPDQIIVAAVLGLRRSLLRTRTRAARKLLGK